MIEDELLTLAHVKGQYQIADLLAKALSPQLVTQLLDYIGCVTQAPEEDARKEGLVGKATSEGTAKSLLVPSCLLSPVKAQPTDRQAGEQELADLGIGAVSVACDVGVCDWRGSEQVRLWTPGVQRNLRNRMRLRSRGP